MQPNVNKYLKEHFIQDGGTLVHPWLIHVDVAKPTTITKVISLQLKLINCFLKKKEHFIKEKIGNL